MGLLKKMKELNDEGLPGACTGGKVSYRKRYKTAD